jgi:hypothetical protein
LLADVGVRVDAAHAVAAITEQLAATYPRECEVRQLVILFGALLNARVLLTVRG